MCSHRRPRNPRETLTATIGTALPPHASPSLGFVLGGRQPASGSHASVVWIAIVAGDGLTRDTNAIQTGIARCACVPSLHATPFSGKILQRPVPGLYRMMRRQAYLDTGCRSCHFDTSLPAVDARCVTEQRPIARLSSAGQPNCSRIDRISVPASQTPSEQLSFSAVAGRHRDWYSANRWCPSLGHTSHPCMGYCLRMRQGGILTRLRRAGATTVHIPVIAGRALLPLSPRTRSRGHRNLLCNRFRHRNRLGSSARTTRQVSPVVHAFPSSHASVFASNWHCGGIAGIGCTGITVITGDRHWEHNCLLGTNHFPYKHSHHRMA